MKPDDAMRLITVLRGHGFTVEVSGTLEAECIIRTSNDDTSDMVWNGFAKSTEGAVHNAARALFVYLHEASETIAPFIMPEDL